MHKIRQLVKNVNRTHKHLGALIAMNIIAAKAKKTILNVAPAGCGKSVACMAAKNLLRDRSKLFTSITLAGMIRIKKEFDQYDGHIIIDDLGAEKSLWSRTSTITVLANIVYSHYIDKVTHQGRVQILGFNGSVSLNIQPVLMNTLVNSDEWVSVVRDKVIRYYHLYRPIKPVKQAPSISVDWGVPLDEVKVPRGKGKLWYELISIGLTQWGYSRVIEHIPDMLRAVAALDNRRKVNVTDYRLLIKLLRPLQLERYIVDTYGFESGRVFNNNLYCILVELATFGTPSIAQLSVDYKVSPITAERLVKTEPQWCWVKANSPKKVMPTEPTEAILKLCGANQKW